MTFYNGIHIRVSRSNGVVGQLEVVSPITFCKKLYQKLCVGVWGLGFGCWGVLVLFEERCGW